MGWDDPLSDEGAWIVPVESGAAAALVGATGIESTAFERIHYSRSRVVPFCLCVRFLVRAMALADNTLFIAGPQDVFKESGPQARYQEGLILKQEAALNGKSGAVLRSVSAETGKTLSEYTLKAPPVIDGMVAAKHCIFLTTVDGKLHCLDANANPAIKSETKARP